MLRYASRFCLYERGDYRSKRRSIIPLLVRNRLLQAGTLHIKKRPFGVTDEERPQYHIFKSLTVPIEPITVDKLVMGLVLMKYLQTPQGREQLSKIAVKYLDVVGKTMSSLSIAGGSHPLASLIHGRITVSVYETLGLIQPQMARVLHSNMEDNINKIITKQYLSDIIGGIGQIVPG